MEQVFKYQRTGIKLVYGIIISIILFTLFLVQGSSDSIIAYLTLPLLLLAVAFSVEHFIFKKYKVTLKEKGIEIQKSSRKELIKYSSITEVKFDWSTPNLILNTGYQGKVQYVIPSGRLGKSQMNVLYSELMKKV